MLDDNKANNGCGLLGFMFLLFLALKLTGVINWSWWWVTLPLWGGFAVLIVMFVLSIIYAMIFALYKN